MKMKCVAGACVLSLAMILAGCNEEGVSANTDNQAPEQVAATSEVVQSTSVVPGKDDAYYEELMRNRAEALIRNHRSFRLPGCCEKTATRPDMTDEEFLPYIKRWDTRLHQTIQTITHNPPPDIKAFLDELVAARETAIQNRDDYLPYKGTNLVIKPNQSAEEFREKIIRLEARDLIKWDFRTVIEVNSKEEAQEAYQKLATGEYIACPGAAKRGTQISVCTDAAETEIWQVDTDGRHPFIKTGDWNASLARAKDYYSKE